MASKLSQLEEELKASKENNIQLKEKLKAVEGGKEELEAEMKKLRVQTEQWRKAVAAVLAGGVEMNGRIPGRCGSMDKHFGGVFEVPHAGYADFVGSPGNIDDLDMALEAGSERTLGSECSEICGRGRARSDPSSLCSITLYGSGVING